MTGFVFFIPSSHFSFPQSAHFRFFLRGSASDALEVHARDVRAVWMAWNRNQSSFGSLDYCLQLLIAPSDASHPKHANVVRVRFRCYALYRYGEKLIEEARGYCNYNYYYFYLAKPMRSMVLLVLFLSTLWTGWGESYRNLIQVQRKHHADREERTSCRKTFKW